MKKFKEFFNRHFNDPQAPIESSVKLGLVMIILAIVIGSVFN